jgi:hypothetical protein
MKMPRRRAMTNIDRLFWLNIRLLPIRTWRRSCSSVAMLGSESASE